MIGSTTEFPGQICKGSSSPWGGDAGVVGLVGGGGSDLFITPTPTTANGVNSINEDENGEIENGVRRRRAVSLSALLCAKAAGMCRAFSSNHENVVNNG